jgi:hypothetical protein
VPAVVVAGLVVERAQRPVGQAVGEEVQVVEADQRAELDAGIDRAAHRHRQHGVGAELLEPGEVGLVGDVVGEPQVALLVARDVEHVDAANVPRETNASPHMVATGSGPVPSKPGSE